MDSYKQLSCRYPLETKKKTFLFRYLFLSLTLILRIIILLSAIELYSYVIVL
jgi:hypothetical protein